MRVATALEPVVFHFDSHNHRYSVEGKEIPHITGMLLQVGLMDDTWFTEESCDRGTAVHDLTAAYDLGALDPRSLVSNYKPYVLAHVAAMNVLRPTMLAVEEPEVHPRHRFGGRPDRIAKVHKVLTVLEVKTGAKEKSHQIQTALQAILVAWRYGLQPQLLQRFALYYRRSGAYSLEPHKERRDYDEAYRVIKECCCA